MNRSKPTLFCITADYRPKSENNPKYYVMAENRRSAKSIFSGRISWLRIYGAEPYDGDPNEILSHPDRHIILGV